MALCGICGCVGVCVYWISYEIRETNANSKCKCCRHNDVVARELATADDAVANANDDV